VVFFVPSGRESEFQFSTQAGLQGIAAEAQCRYSIYTSIDSDRTSGSDSGCGKLALILTVYDDGDYGDCARHDMFVLMFCALRLPLPRTVKS
jgi:hypothetical protein